MACPTCDHTMEKILVAPKWDSDVDREEYIYVWHCSRCGTVKTRKETDGVTTNHGVYVPKSAEAEEKPPTTAESIQEDLINFMELQHKVNQQIISNHKLRSTSIALLTAEVKALSLRVEHLEKGA